MFDIPKNPGDFSLLISSFLLKLVDTEILAEHLLQIEKIATSEPLSSMFLAQPPT